MLYPLSSRIIQHFHSFVISYANIFTSYTPLTVAKQPPFVTFRRSPNLRDLLVKAAAQLLYWTIIFRQASSAVDKSVPLVQTRTNGLTCYTFYATGETRYTTLHITCNNKNVIYMVQSNRFNLQYIGETKRRLKDSFNEHRRAVETKIKSKPITVSEHFLSHTNHSHTDMLLIPLEKIHSSRDSVRKARKSHLIDKAMTLEPHGLNRRDELL